jgi:transposase-like protein
MLLDGHSAPSVAERLGLPGPNALYRWKRETLHLAGPAPRTLGERVAQLQDELRRVERELNICVDVRKSISYVVKAPGGID